jgi:exodeoxyribonuclease VII large subunit
VYFYGFEKQNLYQGAVTIVGGQVELGYYTVDYFESSLYNVIIMQEENHRFSGYKTILTVSELTQKVKTCLEGDFEEVWVEGEISNFRRPSSGHSYLTLKDEKSQIRAVIFRFMGRYLKFEPQDGMLVICRGKMSVYEPRGEYQLILDYMEPKGVGALQLAFEQLKERLAREGLFAADHKKPLPYLPRKIGIVTSPTGAAVKDLLNVIGRRFSTISILITPVKVQGEGSAQEITQAIDGLNLLDDIDLIIVARGGGSLEDLWSFNEECVARAIYRSAIPVVSAVGHEIDFTIADFVADLRAPTPSAAGELVVRDRGELLNFIDSLSDRLRNRILQILESEKKQAQQVMKRLPDLRFRLSDLQLRVDDLKTRLAPRLNNVLRLQKEMLKGSIARLSLRNPKSIIQEYSTRVLLNKKTLIDRMQFVLRGTRQTLESAAGQLDSLSPLRVLERGYSITRLLPSRQVVKESTMVAGGDRVNVVLGKGTIDCKVEKVHQ